MFQKISVALVISAIFACGLAGCNTVNGFGKDLQSGGKAISKTAKKVKG